MKTHIELGITPLQHRNHARLALRVRDLKPDPRLPRLDMSTYAREKKDEFGGNHRYISPAQMPETVHENACGTSCCYVGHGPLVGIMPVNSWEGWPRYIHSCFGFSQWGDNMRDGRWDYLFGPSHVNDLRAAALRSAYWLERGLPRLREMSAFYHELEVPARFKPKWDEIERIAMQVLPGDPITRPLRTR